MHYFMQNQDQRQIGSSDGNAGFFRRFADGAINNGLADFEMTGAEVIKAVAIAGILASTQ